MIEFKTIKQGIHKGKKWELLQATKHTLKQFENSYFFQWENEEIQWIYDIEARKIKIELGEYPQGCAKYFLK